jgi:hypothetical protein
MTVSPRFVPQRKVSRRSRCETFRFPFYFCDSIEYNEQTRPLETQCGCDIREAQFAAAGFIS